MKLLVTFLAIGAVLLSASCLGKLASPPTEVPPPMVSPATVATDPPVGATVAPSPSPSPLPVASPAAPGQVCFEQTESGHVLPDPTCTPGYVDGRVSPATLATTICQAGYTDTVRPGTSYTDPLRDRQMALYGLVGTNAITGQPWKPTDVEEDHLISLELGGNPRDQRNLWPEPQPDARLKDKVENELHKRVCQGVGALQLATAQQAISLDWVKAYEQYVGPLP